MRVYQFSLLAVFIALVLAHGKARAANQSVNPGQGALPASAWRTFEVVYTATVPQVPEGARRLDLWLPVPSSDPQQAITNVRVDSPLPYEFQTEKEYGNRLLHAWSDHPERMSITLRFECTRAAEVTVPAGEQQNVSLGPKPTERLLQADHLGVIDDRIRTLAAQITAGKTETLAKARAIYEYVIGHMAYDKTAPGWGNGDTLRACEVGKGNCTDFHALFISLVRASNVPARFGIGFQIPADQKDGEIAGYHCWAEFWLPGTGWVPVDASEAWKNPKLRGSYFGNLDHDRLRLSLGRDVKLPGMQGEPLNYLLSPYLEVDGKPMKADRSVAFSKVEPVGAR